ncbi:hypothetical protein CVT24_005116, partial [Panaeolus cyanescens]
MHEVLQIPHLVAEIFQWLEDDRLTCYAGTLVCRSFTNEAQRILFRSIDKNMKPLMKLLPLVRKGRAEDPYRDVWHLTGPLRESDLKKFIKLASDVRKISSDRVDQDIKIEPNVYLDLLMQLPPSHSQPLFSNLRELDMKVKILTSEPIHVMLALAGSAPLLEVVRLMHADNDNLRVSRAMVPDWTSVFSDFIRRLQTNSTRALRMRHLEVYPDMIDELAYDAIPTSFLNLRSLALYNSPQVVCSYDYLRKISKLRYLSKLSLGTVWFHMRSSLEPPSRASSEIPFPHLDELSLSCPLGRAIDILSISSFPKVRRLEYYCVMEDDNAHPRVVINGAEEWSTFFDVLRSAAPSLKSVSLYACTFRSTGVWRDTQLHAGLFPCVEFGDGTHGVGEKLRALQGLEALNIGFPLFRLLTLDDYLNMSVSWKESMTVLRIHVAGVPREVLGDQATCNFVNINANNINTANAAPYISTGSALAPSGVMWLDELSRIAGYFPNLKTLEVDVDVQSEYLENLEAEISTIANMFIKAESPIRLVLQNPYLIHEIFQFLQDSPQELCSLSCAWRSFRKPAQDVLWRTIDFDLLPLIRLLPTARYLTDEGDGTGVWCLDGPITPADIDKVVSFGRRVRNLVSTTTNPSCSISISTYLSLATALHNRHLLPSLQHLTIQLKPPFFTFILSLIHSPRLTILELGECPIHDTLAPLDLDISTFIQKHASSKALRQLRVSSTLTPRALDTIATFKNLHNLQLNMSTTSAIPYPFLVSLSTLEHLQELNIDGASFAFTPEERHSDLSFPSLTQLLISCPLQDLTDLFAFAKFPALYDLTYEFILPPEPHSHTFDWCRFLDALYSATHIDSFRELYVIPCADHPPTHPHTHTHTHTATNAQELHDAFLKTYPGVPFSSLSSSLLQFNTLKYLTFGFPLFSSLTQEDFERLMRAMPGLETLELRCAAKGTVDASILQHIARGLPVLKSLTLDIFVFRIAGNSNSSDRTSHVKDLSGSTAQRDLYMLLDVSNHPLEQLHLRMIGFERRDVGEVTAFALLVDALFPYLKEF